VGRPAPSRQTFPLVEASGSPYEVGFQHGRQCQALIPSFVDRGLAWLNHYQPMSRQEALHRARAYLPHARDFAPDLVEEMQGIADGAEVSLDEVLLLNVRTLLLYTAPPGCTAFAVVPPATADGSVLFGQNHDWDPAGERFGLLLHLRPRGKPPVLMFGYPGQVGFIGMNAAGVGLAMNLLRSPGWRVGVPHYLIARRCLEQESVAACIELIARAHRPSSVNLLLADRHGAVSVETTPTDHVVLPPDERGVLVHTNHYRAPQFLEQERLLAELPDSPARSICATRALRQRAGRIDRGVVEDLLRDHQGYPVSICRHATDKPGSLETVVGFVGCPARGEVSVAVGNPCESTFQTYVV
jgi:isopenicillin-N N-acyltransferase-like protein